MTSLNLCAKSLLKAQYRLLQSSKNFVETALQKKQIPRNSRAVLAVEAGSVGETSGFPCFLSRTSDCAEK